MPTVSSVVEWLQAAIRLRGQLLLFVVELWHLGLLRPGPGDQGRRLYCRQVVSLSTCTNVGDITFVVGVAVGFTLKRRLCRWAARLLKRIKDDD